MLALAIARNFSRSCNVFRDHMVIPVYSLTVIPRYFKHEYFAPTLVRMDFLIEHLVSGSLFIVDMSGYRGSRGQLLTEHLLNRGHSRGICDSLTIDIDLLFNLG